MSRIIEELLKADKAAAQPMGFRTSRQEAAGARLRVVACAKLENGIHQDSTNGADAVLLMPDKMPPAVKAVKTATEPIKDIPWGLYLKDTVDSKTEALVKEGCDFIVFPAASLVSAVPEDEDTGKIIEVESSLDDGLLRAINDLPVDAVLFRDSLEKEGPLEWHQLMIFQHMTNLLIKPILIQVQIDATESDIKALWEAGADGVIAEIDTENPEGIKKLRELIDGLPARKAQKKETTEALLPYQGGFKAAEPEPEEDEEEWE